MKYLGEGKKQEASCDHWKEGEINELVMILLHDVHEEGN